jgi:predicted Fe-Mo cluster-binding NifX family protein
MKVAMTVWDGRVAPVFDTAQFAMIMDVENGTVRNQHNEAIADNSPPQKVMKLREWGVETLVCGAISKTFADLVSFSGIRLIPFVSGNVEEVLQALAVENFQLPEFSMPGCGCRHQGRRRRRGGCQSDDGCGKKSARYRQK